MSKSGVIFHICTIRVARLDTTRQELYEKALRRKPAKAKLGTTREMR